ncbi:MAG: hypothetical protein OXG37_09420 [Actinomycetia bacterium]|nr:hypothetical protein [Actinomycetes bacterium]
MTGADRPDMRSELPGLITCQQIQEELGVTRAAAESVMRQLKKIRFPGSRRVYVRHDDVRRQIEQSTSRGKTTDNRRAGARDNRNDEGGKR